MMTLIIDIVKVTAIVNITILVNVTITAIVFSWFMKNDEKKIEEHASVSIVEINEEEEGSTPTPVTIDEESEEPEESQEEIPSIVIIEVPPPQQQKEEKLVVTSSPEIQATTTTTKNNIGTKTTIEETTQEEEKLAEATSSVNDDDDDDEIHPSPVNNEKKKRRDVDEYEWIVNTAMSRKRRKIEREGPCFSPDIDDSIYHNCCYVDPIQEDYPSPSPIVTTTIITKEEEEEKEENITESSPEEEEEEESSSSQPPAAFKSLEDILASLGIDEEEDEEEESPSVVFASSSSSSSGGDYSDDECTVDDNEECIESSLWGDYHEDIDEMPSCTQEEIDSPPVEEEERKEESIISEGDYSEVCTNETELVKTKEAEEVPTRWYFCFKEFHEKQKAKLEKKNGNGGDEDEEDDDDDDDDSFAIGEQADDEGSQRHYFNNYEGDAWSWCEDTFKFDDESSLGGDASTYVTWREDWDYAKWNYWWVANIDEFQPREVWEYNWHKCTPVDTELARKHIEIDGDLGCQFFSRKKRKTSN